MNITPVNVINFGSRDKKIRFADDIARYSARTFPCVSVTKLAPYCRSKAQEKSLNELSAQIDNVRATYFAKYPNAKTFGEQVDSIVGTIQSLKVGNCGESSLITSFVARLNGLKNVYVAELRKGLFSPLDHCVIFVKDKKPYVIDSWLGFADYFDRAIQRYKNEFADLLNIPKDADISIMPMSNAAFADILKPNFTKAELEQIRKKFPEMIMKKIK